MGFLAAHLGHPLQLELLLALDLFELRSELVEALLLVGELALASSQILVLTVEVLLFLEKALFDLL